MTARLLPLASQPDDFWKSWDSLNAEHNLCHPLLQARMVKLLVQHFPSEIQVLTVTQHDHPAALILVNKPAKGRPLTRRGYLPAQSQIALAQLASDCVDLRRELFRALPPTIQRFDLLFVDSLYQARIIQEPGIELTPKGLDMSVSLEGSFQDYWHNRPKRLKKNVSRYLHRVESELGLLRFEVITAPSSIEAAVDRYGILESEGWKGANGTALHPDNRQGKFYRALLHEYASTGEAMVFEFYHEDRLIASRLTIHNNKMLVFLKTTFKEDYKRYAIGRLLLYRVIEHLFSEGSIAHIAFYTNATPEQLEWATESRPTYDVSLYRYPGIVRLQQWASRIRRTTTSDSDTDKI